MEVLDHMHVLATLHRLLTCVDRSVRSVLYYCPLTTMYALLSVGFFQRHNLLAGLGRSSDSTRRYLYSVPIQVHKVVCKGQVFLSTTHSHILSMFTLFTKPDSSQTPERFDL